MNQNVVCVPFLIGFCVPWIIATDTRHNHLVDAEQASKHTSVPDPFSGNHAQNYNFNTILKDDPDSTRGLNELSEARNSSGAREEKCEIPIIPNTYRKLFHYFF